MKKNLQLFDVPKIDSIQDMLLNSCGEYKHKLALEDLTNTPISSLTYDELLNNVLKFGSALKAIGLEECAHIAIIGENRVQWALSFLTASAFNYVIVPIDKNLTKNEVYNIIHESESTAIIYSESFSEMIESAKHSLKNLKHLICMDSTTEEEDVYEMKTMIDKAELLSVKDLPKINPDDLAEIIFTSGSLGRAKGVMLSQKNIASNLVDMLGMLFMYPEDRFLSVLPMHHTYECTCGTLCPLYAGSSIHYSLSLKTIVDDIQKVKATIMLGVPLLYDKLFKRISSSIKEDKVKSIVVPALVKATNLTAILGFTIMKKKVFKELHNKFGGHIRVFIAGGAAPDPLVAKGLREYGFSFIQGYGLTETSPILALNRIDNFKDDAAGIPLSSVEIRISKPDEDGIGEIFAKGPNVMLGYYKNENQTDETFEDGWLKTGDYGFIDKDGFLHISGRKKNVIISKSGKNVFPEEIEDILNRSPFVLESIIFGDKDEKQGEVIAALIVPDAEAFISLSETENKNISDDLVKTILQEEIGKTNKQLSGYKRIVRFKVREHEFEKTTTQKIKRYLIEKK